MREAKSVGVIGAPHGANYDSTREPILATSEASREYTKTSSIP